MEYTQEQLDALINEKIGEATKGLFTEDELTRRVTSEVDRRVESGIQKGLETHKAKWEEEFSKKAKMTAEELAKAELDAKLGDLSKRESEIALRANKAEAKDMLSDAGIPKAQYEKFLGVLVNSDAESTKVNVENFITMFTETKTEIETKVKTELTIVPPPKKGTGTDGITKEQFVKMPYGEKVKFKSEHPELYKEYMK